MEPTQDIYLIPETDRDRLWPFIGGQKECFMLPDRLRDLRERGLIEKIENGCYVLTAAGKKVCGA